MRIKEYEKIIEESTDEEEKNRLQDLITFNMDMIKNTRRPAKDTDSYFLPEYRKDGYFQSREFKLIEAKVDSEVLKICEQQKLTPYECEIIKQEILKNEYGLNWVPLSKQFMPGVMVFID